MPAHRFASPLAALLMSCTMLSGTAHAGWFDLGSSKDDAKSAQSSDGAKVQDKTNQAPLAAETLDTNIQKAHALRLAGSYDDAIKALSQMMLVASDDGRVVSEYGKTLAAMGRATDAINFLTRAQQLTPEDWTVYSAMGVAYDESGDQVKAAQAYDHALKLKPGEPSVLSNYALSRMLAKDPDGAKKLIARAEIAGGASDTKIARNIAMIKDLAPENPDKAFDVNTPAPAPVPHVAAAALPAPAMVARQQAPFVNLPAPTTAPRALQPANTGMIDAAPQPQMAQVQPRGVVMQRVPVDPLAGPVEAKISLAQAPRAPKAKPEVAKAVAQAQPQSAAAAANDLQAKADAIAKQLAGKPAAIAAAKAEASKPEAAKPAVATAKPAPQVAQAKPTETKPTETKPVPVKAAEAKPAEAPKPAATAPKPVPQASKVASAAKPTDKNAVPSLRMSANAY